VVGTTILEGGEESEYLVQDCIAGDILAAVLQSINEESTLYQLV
jgi:hypothetical protein